MSEQKLRQFKGFFRAIEDIPEHEIKKGDEVHSQPFGIFHVRRVVIKKLDNDSRMDFKKIAAISSPTKVLYQAK